MKGLTGLALSSGLARLHMEIVGMVELKLQNNLKRFTDL